jgi:hypothetical protein
MLLNLLIVTIFLIYTHVFPSQIIWFIFSGSYRFMDRILFLSKKRNRRQPHCIQGIVAGKRKKQNIGREKTTYGGKITISKRKIKGQRLWARAAYCTSMPWRLSGCKPS